MKIWVLYRKDYVGYDEYEGHVIRAANEEEARGIANAAACDEGEIWYDGEKVSCNEISAEGLGESILSAFNAG